MKRLLCRHHLQLVVTGLIIISGLLSACGEKALSAEQLIATGVAETLAAAGTSLALHPIPTNTPIPPTTQPPPPTLTTTATATATETPLPTEPPIPSATPGPFLLYDDFTADTGNWEDCQYCTWENNALTMGPFPASSEIIHMNLCTGCGNYSTYHMFVDGTFVDGQVDRFFGIVFGVTETTGYYFGVSPWQFYVILEYHADDEAWEILELEWSGAVHASYATNNLEVRVLPTGQTRTVDILMYLNSTLIHTIYNRPAVNGLVGLGMDFHDVTARFDNLIYEEIEAIP